jgi:heptosyltransferase-2
MAGPDRILVRLPNWLGDALLARPLLHGLARARPHAEVRGVGPAALVDLLLADRALGAGDAWPRDARGRAEVVRRARAWRPGVALVLPASFSSAWFAWRSGAPVRAGYRGEGRSFLLTHALPRSERGALHLSREFLALGAALGVEEAAPPPLGLGAGARAAAQALLERRGAGGRRYAVLGPRSAWGAAREWPAERFADVGRALAARGLRVVVCGTAAEGETCARVAAAVGSAALSLAGETDLPTLAALCGGAALAVCNDSGLAHLAAAAGAPTVQIYGSASSAWTAALGPRVRVVQRPPVCSPCYQRTCRIGYRCLVAIEAAVVLRACEELAA